LDRGPILEQFARFSHEARERADAILGRHEREAARCCRLQDGATEVLDMLRREDMGVGLLTRNSRASVETVCSRLSLRFDATVSREDAPLKPSPEPVLLACRQLGADPRQALVVGDFVFDIVAGNAAGAWTALLCSRSRQLPDVDADFEIRSLLEIRDIVDTLRRPQPQDGTTS